MKYFPASQTQEALVLVFDFNIGGYGNAQAPNITLVFLSDSEPPKPVSLLLDHMQGTGKWGVALLTIDDAVAKAFRCVKVPALMVYNSKSEETARVYGDQNIHDLLHRIME